ncbi:MAG: PASTA domain-containing protein [Acidobacteria bacterium]|nr:PASTA domain-containing protein [Acidobacteriota bacterium]
MSTLPHLSPRMNRYAIWAFQILLLVSTASVAGITAMRMAIHGREVGVPNVVGVPAGDAQQILSGRGLALKVADRVYSNLPRDRVVRQSPAAGARVKLTQRIHVVLSLGTQKVSIPELEGKSSRAARIELLRSGLQVGEISSLTIPDQEPDKVILQNPPPEAKNAGSPRVNMLVTAPTRPIAFVMPDFVDLTAAEAQRRITALGLRLARMSSAVPGIAPRNTVVSQIPPRGSRIFPGTAVELMVAD